MSSTDNTTNPDRPIFVGIGASAGGLEAFTEFLRGLPDDHGMIIALVQHLDPNHESLMPELVAAKTGSPVHSVEDDMEVEAGHIYLIPPGYEMKLKDNRLRLTEYDSPRGLRRPINQFFRSLAEEVGDRAVAVVLSGTGSDGADGAREVKGSGGLVFVQDPKEAKYDGMPRSVIDQGSADVVSRAAEVIDVVRDYFNLRAGGHKNFDSDEDFLARIMRHVRFRTGHDFADYKKATMLRRVAVRMSVLNIQESGEYLKYIAEHKEEAERLFRELLINVTSFFRDPQHFEALQHQVVPEIVANAEEQGEIRIWIAGCSTGEEAYTLGMLLSEEVSRTNRHCSVIIFGTDIDEAALKKARLGQYPDAIADVIPEALLSRYFRTRNNGFEVGSQLREMVRFSRHSFVKDPPFSNVDMVSCRNVLIYFKERLQDTAIRVFHYALKEGGFLFVGPSENPKPLNEYFEEVSSHSRIFKRRPGAAKSLNLGSFAGQGVDLRSSAGDGPATTEAQTNIDGALLANHVPAHIHIDRRGDVLFASKNVTKYLGVRAGKMSNAATSLIASELETSLRRVLRVDDRAGSTLEREYQGQINGEEARVVLMAERLGDGSVLLVLHDRLQLREGRPGIHQGEGQNDAYLQELEVELDEARQAVRTTVEELETSNEELKSSNEEMMSMNEELQSANEELTTINDELQEKLRELNQANTDLTNFTESARIATVFLDKDLELRNFSPQAKTYFSFTDKDLSRPIADLSAAVDLETLLEACQAVLTDHEERSLELEAADLEQHLKVMVMPYAPDGKVANGVVFTLQDVTELRDAIEDANSQRRLAEQRTDEVEQIYATSPLAMGLIDGDMRYVRLNEKLAEVNDEPIERHIGARIRDIIPDVADQTEAIVRQVMETGEAVKGQRVQGHTRSDPDNPRIWESDWLPHYSDKEITGVSVTVRDITNEVATSESLRSLMRELEHRVKNMLANVGALINQARREVKGDAEVYHKLTKRIDGLAKTHALLTAEQWSSALLRDVFAPETEAIYGEENVSLSGPDVRVNAQATLALGMAIHELATNAAKYGAFSTEQGKVAVKWSRITDADGDRLRIEWQESGGPKVTKPDRSGFGSQLVRSTIEGTLDGNISVNWEPSGLSVVVEVDYIEVTALNDRNDMLH